MRKKNQKLFLYFLGTFLFIFFLTKKALAVCPICTFAVGAGLGLSRWLGIDDTISGLWIGGITVSIIIWTESYLDKKNIHFKGRILVNILAYTLLIIVPLYYTDILGNPLNTLCACGLDKLFFGMISGAIAFWCGANWYLYLKEKNGGHAYFPFQKVAMPILPILVLSIIFYFLIK